MYSVFLDGWQFPVTPPKLNVAIKGKNKTLTLVNDGEINFLKTPGLTEIDSFDASFPMLAAYPFAVYPNGFKPPDYFLGKLESLMTNKKPAQFIVSRVSPAGKLLFSTNMQVSVESYTIKESATDGLDVTVSIKLKQYKSFSTKTVTLPPVVTTPAPTTTTTAAKPTTTKKAVKVGDVVDFTGTKHYTSSTGNTGYTCRPGKATVTKIASGAKHPYHLVRVSGKGSTVYGWVDAVYVDGATSASTKSTATVTTSRAATTAPKAKTYTVKKGDTLWAIAKKYTGSGAKYTQLYNANTSKIKNPNLIYVGQVLTLPW